MNIDRTKRVAGIGSNVVDVIYRVNQIAGPEEKTYVLFNDEGSVVKEVIGGVTLNHLAWANLLHVPTGLFGYQGDDRYGVMIREEMGRHGIDSSAIRVKPGAPSSFSIVNVGEDANRAIYMARALTGTTTGTDIHSEFSEYIRSSAIVSTEISQLPLDAVIAVLRTAREAGIPTVLDVDVPPDFAIDVAGLGSSEDFEEAVSLADVLKPAKAAADQMVTGNTPEEKAVGLQAKYGSALVAITDGESGCVLTDGTQTRRIAARKITARDTTGAGDAFLGGLIAGIYHGLSFDHMGELANACGAVCCLVDGAFPLRESSLDDLKEFYNGPGINDQGRISVAAADPGHEATASGDGVSSVRIAGEALLQVVESMSDAYFDDAVKLVRDAESAGCRVHVCGVGKPRHIGHKITATLQSTGTRAYFLDPTDCNHGDSGQVAPGDVVVAISHSGKTRELLEAVATVRRNGARVIGITGDNESDLAALSDAVLHVPVSREAGALGLAPTASTTCQLAVGDGFAIALKTARGFTVQDFKRFHPSGSLGKQLEDL